MILTGSAVANVVKEAVVGDVFLAEAAETAANAANRIEQGAAEAGELAQVRQFAAIFSYFEP